MNLEKFMLRGGIYRELHKPYNHLDAILEMTIVPLWFIFHAIVHMDNCAIYSTYSRSFPDRDDMRILIN